MSRVLALVEGPTERAVIQGALSEYLANRGISIRARIIGKPGHKGGNNFNRALTEISNLLKQEPGSVVTTFFDYYALPGDWPGRQESTGCMDSEGKALIIEKGLNHAVSERFHDKFDTRRFIPYIQMYELEALLFSGPAIMAEMFQNTSLTSQFEKIVQECGGCEEINDNQETAPSKRIHAVYPRYKKGSSVNAHAPLIVEKTGIDAIREKCPHFNEWIGSLIDLKEGKGAG